MRSNTCFRPQRALFGYFPPGQGNIALPWPVVLWVVFLVWVRGNYVDPGSSDTRTVTSAEDLRRSAGRYQIGPWTCHEIFDPLCCVTDRRSYLRDLSDANRWSFVHGLASRRSEPVC